MTRAEQIEIGRQGRLRAQRRKDEARAADRQRDIRAAAARAELERVEYLYPRIVALSAENARLRAMLEGTPC